MGLTGHLDLVCGLDLRGLSTIKRQSFRAPMHVSKAHLEDGVLTVNVINPTAGLLSGDRIECRVEVETGARLLLTTPSASRAHSMKAGRAELTQEFQVARDAFLEIWPELFIPQSGARYRQKTTVRLERGSELIFFELLAPGRVAAGEVFAYAELDWETDVFMGTDLIARERYRMERGGDCLRALQARFATGYYASCFVVTPRLDEQSPCWDSIHELHEGSAWIGVSRLAQDGWAVRVVAANSVGLRKKLAEIRRLLYEGMKVALPGLRRVAGVG